MAAIAIKFFMVRQIKRHFAGRHDDTGCRNRPCRIDILPIGVRTFVIIHLLQLGIVKKAFRLDSGNSRSTLINIGYHTDIYGNDMLRRFILLKGFSSSFNTPSFLFSIDVILQFRHKKQLSCYNQIVYKKDRHIIKLRARSFPLDFILKM